MITNHDIELAFVRAQNRINEEISNAQVNFVLPDLVKATDAMVGMIRKKKGPDQNENNPVMNEEI